jgi:hypothetical protein
MKRMLSTALAVLLAASLMPVVVFATEAEIENDPITTFSEGEPEAEPSAASTETITYLDETGAPQTVEAIVLSPTLESGVCPDTIELADSGWYFVDSSYIKFSQRLQIKADVKLILLDYQTLEFEAGIDVPAGSSITIYSQSTGEGQGTLKAPLLHLMDRWLTQAITHPKAVVSKSR